MRSTLGFCKLVGESAIEFGYLPIYDTYRTSFSTVFCMAQQNQQDEQDQPWKQIFRLYFREGIEFLFPEIACEIDWSKPIDFWIRSLEKLRLMQ